MFSLSRSSISQSALKTLFKNFKINLPSGFMTNLVPKKFNFSTFTTYNKNQYELNNEYHISENVINQSSFQTKNDDINIHNTENKKEKSRNSQNLKKSSVSEKNKETVKNKSANDKQNKPKPSPKKESKTMEKNDGNIKKTKIVQKEDIEVVESIDLPSKGGKTKPQTPTPNKVDKPDQKKSGPKITQEKTEKAAMAKKETPKVSDKNPKTSAQEKKSESVTKSQKSQENSPKKEKSMKKTSDKKEN